MRARLPKALYVISCWNGQACILQQSQMQLGDNDLHRLSVLSLGGSVHERRFIGPVHLNNSDLLVVICV